MPPQLALVLTLSFILFLFYLERKQKHVVSGAIWIPLIWMMLIGSRFVSEWLNMGSPMDSTADFIDGSPIDRAVFLLLILAGLCVLIKRKVCVTSVLQNNKALIVFLAYCALSISWSDFSMVAFKRFIKILGHPIMALVLLTERNPVEGVKVLMKRCAYFLIPLSILFIKYYPHLGRGFSYWTGQAYNTGVTTNKNALGNLCMILGFFFVWNLLITRKLSTGSDKRKEIFISLGFLTMIWWLLRMADSATSLLCLVLGSAVLIVLGFRFISKRFLGVYILGGALLLFGMEATFALTTNLIEALGRETTLTGRTEVWEDVLSIRINPVLGTGFESFWLGDRAEKMWAKHWWRPNQAHNGYLETYLNLGWLGLVLLISWLYSAYRKGRLSLLTDFNYGRMRLAFLVIVLAYNFTEATFKALHLVWFVFFIIAMDYTLPHSRSEDATSTPLLEKLRPGE